MISNAKRSPSSSTVKLLLLFLSMTASWAKEDTAQTSTSLRHSTTKESTPAGDKPKPDQAFCVGNGIKCDGGAFTKKGYFLKCEGGLKFGGFKKDETTEEEDSYEYVVDDIEEESRTIASDLRDHIVNGEYSLNVKDFMPSEDIIEQIDTMVDGDTVEFGGFSVVGWGCKAKSFEKKKFMAMKAECGAKGMKGMGMKSMVEYGGNAETELTGVGVVDGLVLENVSTLMDEYFHDDDDDDDEDDDNDKPKPDAVFCLEKGMKCMGAGIENKGGGAKCEGGGKFNMESKSASDLAQLLHDHMNEGYLLQVEELMPSEEVVKRMQQMKTRLLASESDDDDDDSDDDDSDDDDSDDDDSDDDDGGCEIEFGGFGKFEWGCKVTSSKKGKSVTAECGMKAMKGAGVKPADIEDMRAVTVSSVM